MNTNENNKYDYSEKYWVVSEVKASFIEVFNNFLKCQDNFIRSLKGTIDPTQSKAEYISALFSFYSLMTNGFIAFLDKDKDLEFKEDDYLNLALEEEHDSKKLIKMGYLLQKWSLTHGAFRITHQEKLYKDPVQQLVDEDEM